MTSTISFIDKAPGAYYHSYTVSNDTIRPLRNDIGGFVGISDKGPLGIPVPCESMREYQEFFGGNESGGYLYWSVKGFFENGGQRCWIVRAGPSENSDAMNAAYHYCDDISGVNVLKISALNPGVWGNRISFRLRKDIVTSEIIPAGSLKNDHAELQSLSIHEFEKAVLVHIVQNSFSEYRVISKVDTIKNRIYWYSSDNGLPYDSLISGFNTNESATIECLQWYIDIWESQKYIRRISNIHLIPEHERYIERLFPEFSESFSATELITIKDLRTESNNISVFYTSHPVDTDTRVVLAKGTDGLSLLIPDDFIGSSSGTAQNDLSYGVQALMNVKEISYIMVPDLHNHRQKDPIITLPRKVKQPDPCLPSAPGDIAAPCDSGESVQAVYERIPDFTFTQIVESQSRIVEMCESAGDRITLLSCPQQFSASSHIAYALEWCQYFNSSFAALYFPWIKIYDNNFSTKLREIPPDGYIGGTYSHFEYETGIHRAPANSVLKGAFDISESIDSRMHGYLNEQSINIIKSLSSRGIRVMGARTPSSDTLYRYIPVRRLVIAVERSLVQALQWATFEPNNYQTRMKIVLVISMYLLSIWQRGMLAGSSQEEAFAVQCDEKNNPDGTRKNGRLFIDIKLAPVHPMEYLSIRISRIEDTFEMTSNESIQST